jgi:sulfate adenylyltransferase
MVEEAGGAFFLVHVATPLEECERRDRKGLYAKARRGEIPEFTGISSPYEEPEDADVRVDTTGRTIDEALADVVDALRDAGYLDLDPTPVSVVEPRSSVVEPQRSVVEPVETTDTLRVLFVCTANICRSPFMELVARDLAGPDARVEFTSAGTHGFHDRAVDEVMAATLTPRSLSSEAFLSRALTSDLIEEADLVLTAEATHRTYILDDHPSAFRKVFTLGQFAESVRAADPALGGRDLLTAVGERRTTADPALDVPDPYSRGPEAATASASTIEDLLRIVVPALTGSRKITS